MMFLREIDQHNWRFQLFKMMRCHQASSGFVSPAMKQLLDEVARDVHLRINQVSWNIQRFLRTVSRLSASSKKFRTAYKVSVTLFIRN